MIFNNLNLDENLLRVIKERIKWDIRISTSDLKLKVNHGKIIINGFFDKAYRHSALINAVGTLEGVSEIEDHSQVLIEYYRSDSELKKLILNQIYELPLLPGEWINVDVCDGYVKLEGVVFRTRIKAFASRSAWELSGVKDCLNQIEIKRSGNVCYYPNKLSSLSKINLTS